MASKKSKKSASASSATTKSKAKASKGRGGLNKSAFVRSLPASLSAKDVIARAKAAGLSLTEHYVYNVRSQAKAKGTIAGGTKQAAAGAKKAAAGTKKSGGGAKKSGGRSNVKSAFVLAQPASLSVKEIVAAAKKAGLSISAALVYSLRGKRKGAAPAAKGTAPAAASSGRKGPAPKLPRDLSANIDETELSLQRLAVHIGIERSRALIDQAQRRLAKLL